MPSKERAGGKELEIIKSISSLSGISLVSFFAYNRKRESNGICPILGPKGKVLFEVTISSTLS